MRKLGYGAGVGCGGCLLVYTWGYDRASRMRWKAIGPHDAGQLIRDGESVDAPGGQAQRSICSRRKSQRHSARMLGGEVR
jgi:hypothetical protein